MTAVAEPAFTPIVPGATEMSNASEQFLGHFRRGKQLLDAGNFHAALKEYSAALKLLPRDPVLLNNVGTVLGSLGRDEEAERMFAEALEARPDDPKILANRALALNRTGRFRDALQEVNKALAQTPDDAQVRALHEAILTDMLRSLARKGVASWAGGKPKGSSPLIPISPGPDISDYVIKDRG